MTVTHLVHRCERPSASEGAVITGLRGPGTQWTSRSSRKRRATTPSTPANARHDEIEEAEVVTAPRSPAPADAPLSFPRLHARTQRFTLGEPRNVEVAATGERILFLRSRDGQDPVNCLWVVDAASGDERLLADPAELIVDDVSDSARRRAGPPRTHPGGRCRDHQLRHRPGGDVCRLRPRRTAVRRATSISGRHPRVDRGQSRVRPAPRP